MDKETDRRSYTVIGKAMQAHRELGPGVDERFYHERLADLLQEAGVEHRCKPRECLRHRGVVVDVFEADLLVPGHLVLELKRLQGAFAPAHFVQLKAYLKLWGIRHGLLFDFGKESLVLRRYVYDDPPTPPPLDLAQLVANAPPFARGSPIARRIGEAVSRIAAQFGFGFPDTTYRRLVELELQADGLAAVISPKVIVRVGGRGMGETRLPCLAVQNSWAVMVLSQREEIRAADRAILQSWLRHLGRPCGAILHFGKHEVQIQWVSSPVRGFSAPLGGAPL